MITNKDILTVHRLTTLWRAVPVFLYDGNRQLKVAYIRLALCLQEILKCCVVTVCLTQT